MAAPETTHRRRRHPARSPARRSNLTSHVRSAVTSPGAADSRDLLSAGLTAPIGRVDRLWQLRGWGSPQTLQTLDGGGRTAGGRRQDCSEGGGRSCPAGGGSVGLVGRTSGAASLCGWSTPLTLSPSVTSSRTAGSLSTARGDISRAKTCLTTAPSTLHSQVGTYRKKLAKCLGVLLNSCNHPRGVHPQIVAAGAGNVLL